MADEPALELFARALMTRVRDAAIESCDALAQGRTQGALGQRWRDILSTSEGRAAIDELIPDIVDQVLFRLLDAMDNGWLPLAWIQDGQFRSMTDVGQGEMAGSFMRGEGGWIDQFSRQRYFDALAGLDLGDLD